ncbi:Iron-containing alcohol dehydrogenase [Rhodopseudomonas palustris HaA2]|uniref:Iron-containing alcohol dehydrogenase n=1 Tax=Rhodopseudomonas palustris (strain HaA2) TaxID=316058 RepID=Q2J1K4_RHOP2|nr:iron-containing alcohol dehydrogenase [Rhodopseudomonas palustris]ABD05656.1 Iron-containing alcohol dehydrogenase [Rhodopseudomonas palustris HaA2]
MILPFSIARLPRIEFGAGAIARLPSLAAVYGKRLLLVTGARSFDHASYTAPLLAALRDQSFSIARVPIRGEPSPEMVDDAVRECRRAEIDVVIGLGGGSALDAAKAIAGLLKPGNSVMDHLEGVGPELPYRGPATPFIAVPTTAGTGSEATKNAVLSRHGPDGFKKSFRDEALVAEIALVDPELLAGCPPALIAANGMDALTQLLESYVSTRANPFTDALALSGLRAVRDGLLAWYDGGDAAGEARTQMAYASLLSGICLAQTGLGSVHGLASPLGAFFPIGHGVVCGTLVADATRVNIAAMEARAPQHPALAKYAEIGRLLCGGSGSGAAQDRDALLRTLRHWTQRLSLPRLSSLGVAAADVDRIVAASRGSSMKTNPVVLTDDEIRLIVTSRF